MIIYSDNLTEREIWKAIGETGLSRDGVYLECHGPLGSRKRRQRFIVKLSAEHGCDRFGTQRRWANSGSWGAASDPDGPKAATFDEWGVFIADLFRRDPGAIIGVYGSPADLEKHWQEPALAR